MNKARQGIGADCPNCQRTYEIRDLDKFLEHKLAIWRFILRQIRSSYDKQKLIGSLAVCSAIKTLNKEIDENGGLVATCLPCMIKILKKLDQSKKLNRVECIVK
jgi:coenzyme F420-reducing hydrogenase beta subunit